MRAIGAIVIAFLTVSSSAESDRPIQVVERYATNVESAEHLTEIRYSEFLTQRAQGSVVRGLQRVAPVLKDFDFSIAVNSQPAEIKNGSAEITELADKERMYKFVLRTMKAETSLCTSTQYVEEIDASTATLTCSKTDHKSPSGVVYQQLTQTVEMIDEGGWRIDKIVTEITHDSSTSKSTTFQ